MKRAMFTKPCCPGKRDLSDQASQLAEPSLPWDAPLGSPRPKEELWSKIPLSDLLPCPSAVWPKPSWAHLCTVLCTWFSDSVIQDELKRSSSNASPFIFLMCFGNILQGTLTSAGSVVNRHAYGRKQSEILKFLFDCFPSILIFILIFMSWST